MSLNTFTKILRDPNRRQVLPPNQTDDGLFVQHLTAKLPVAEHGGNVKPGFLP